MSPTVHIVPHTHWDREWYHTAARFEIRLARLVDDVLERLERGSLRSFLLDGQGVVLDDYVAARPDAGQRLARQLERGTVESGPWYVLADNFLVSGEAMVRNLLVGGGAVGRRGGRAMRVGYAPDTFGHPAILPTVLAGFGIGNAVTWRGFGGARGQEKDLYRWRGPDGSDVVMIHLPPQGYENGANLPADAQGAQTRWQALRGVLEARARSPFWLVMNGADHHVVQPDLKHAVSLLKPLAPDCEFVVGPLGDYVRSVEAWARNNAEELPVIEGDLREGRRSQWVLLGTHSARLYLKQANARCQRTLERVAEPLAALARMRRADLRAELQAAWRTLLENHPHDSICGTSTDAVHREMVTRFDCCAEMTDEIVQHAADVVAGHDPNAARALGRDAWRPSLLIFNPAPRARSGVVEARVALFESDVKVGQQGSTSKKRRRTGELILRGPDGKPVPYQELGREDGYDRLESPRFYPDCDAVEWRHVVLAAKDLPPLGVMALKVEERTTQHPAPRTQPPVRVSEFGLENDHLIARVESDGTIALAYRGAGWSAHGLGAIECMADEGDSYTSSPRGENLTAEPDAVATRVIHDGPLRGEIEIERRWKEADLAVTTRVQLDAGARHLECGMEFDNWWGARRIRAAFPLNDRAKRVVADGPFGPVERSLRVQRIKAGEREAPDPNAPMQRYVSLAGAKSGITVFSDGLPQYEARANGDLFVTLMRGFDQLSKNDLPERPGHAGWPTPTPGGRCLGSNRARLAVMLHDADALDSRAALDVAADDFLVPPVTMMRRATLVIPGTMVGPELRGPGLVFSAMKPAESGRGVVLRCYNATTSVVRGSWSAGKAFKSAALCRLDERLLKNLAMDRGGIVRFTAEPRGIVTILLR